jgi:hypothetical protein
MTIRRRAIIAAFCAAFIVGLGWLWNAATTLNYDRKPEHVFPLAGNAPLTDDQAYSFARQILKLDGRPRTTQPWITPVGGDLIVYSRELDSPWDWDVDLKREPGRVRGNSYHGK